MTGDLPQGDRLSKSGGNESEQPVISGEPVEPSPPRVWTVFVALIAALALAVTFQVIFVLVLVAMELGRGVEPNQLGAAIAQKVTSPYVFIMLAALGQLGFAIAGFLPAIKSPVPFRQRVAWLPATPSKRVYPIAMLGTIFPLALGIAAALGVAQYLTPDPSLEAMFGRITIDTAILFVLFIGVVPGVVEEVLFRGYMQQRLTERWGASRAIIVTSMLFALVHVTPHAIAAVVPLGLWFGYVTWRSGSILPAILCHFFVNSGLNAWRMIVKFGEPSETVQTTVQISAVGIGLVCFLVCCSPRFWSTKPS